MADQVPAVTRRLRHHAAESGGPVSADLWVSLIFCIRVRRPHARKTTATMADNTFLRARGDGSQVPITGTNRGGGTGDENPVARLRSTLTKLLGGDVSLTMTTSQAVDLDAYQGAPHAAMGLQVAVSGRVGRAGCRRQAAATV